MILDFGPLIFDLSNPQSQIRNSKWSKWEERFGWAPSASWGGAVIGAGGTASSLVGYGSDGIGGASSYGGFYGPGRTAPDTDRNSGWAIGGAAGPGAGVFVSNANKWEDFNNNFETTMFGWGPWGSVEIDYSCDANNKVIWVAHYYPMILGKGGTFGITHFRTYTPPSSTGRLMDSVDELNGKLVNGIRDLYSY